MSERTKRRWRTILSWFTFLALVGLCYALRHQIIDTLRNLKNVNIYVLLLIIPFEALNYHGQAKLYQHLFRLMRNKLEYWFLIRVTLELNFINTIFPSGGVSGFSFMSLRFRTHGISAAKATVAQMMKMILIFMSFEILMFIGLLFLAIGGQANDLVLFAAASLTTLLLVGTFGVVFVIGSKRRINSFFVFLTRFVNRVIHVIRPNNPETINVERARELFTELHEHYIHLQKNYKELLYPLLFALLANAAEILVIYSVYAAFGQWVNPGAVIIAYAIANFAGLVSVLPGGVGIYEALMTGVLATAGVSPALSLPVTVTYRILNMSLQLPAGYVLYHRTLRANSKNAHVG